MNFPTRIGMTGELARFAVVGIISNATLYLLYLLLTLLGVGPKIAMTIAYLVGALQGFALNRRWTFADKIARMESLPRYAVAYALGYLLNYAFILVLVDRFGIAHQAVQGVAIFVVAIFLFITQKYWVFK